jgi:hypothetical protein
MKPSLALFKSAITFILLFAIFNGASPAAEVKPYKVALIIGDQWQDPASFVVDVQKQTQSEASAAPVTIENEFALLLIMLKGWCVPFQITRLDQEFLDINRFLGPDNKPDVGCIIWDADTPAELLPQRYEVIREAVNDYGISLIALGNRIKEPIIQDLLGIKYIGAWHTAQDLTPADDHFITKTLTGPLDDTDESTEVKKRIHVELLDAEPIVMQGKHPQATVRDLPSGAKAIWLGSDIDRLFSYQPCRTLLRRAITYAIGYSLYKTWENKAWMVMDDPGTAQNAWLDHWHYPTLTEQQIEKHLIKPLTEHNAVLVMNLCPGFVNDRLQRLEPAFQRKLTDEFGTPQDYPSTYRGLVKGLKDGVFEIQCHGLTHMQPDLFSPPGPWYAADLDKERAEIGWYREFGDTRRDREIPAAEASWRINTAKNWLKNLFGVTPLSFRPGGGGVSTSYPNCTERLAARAGFGWGGGRSGYLGPDLAIRGWSLYGTAECPLAIPAPPDGHDKGIAEHPEQFLRAFSDYPDIQWIGINEYVAYTHAKITTVPEKPLTLSLTYDPHYCTHFANNNSSYNLLFSDWLATKLRGTKISVDGKPLMQNPHLTEPLTIKVPPGTGTHTIQISWK